jgi:glycosyltransferase involved in cell wall biosynthesis
VFPDKPLGRGLATAHWIRRTLQRQRCSLAYAILSPTNIYCALACAGTDVGFVASIRGVPTLEGVLRAGLRWAYGRADALVANSASGAMWATDSYDVAGSRIAVIPNAVSPVTRDAESRIRLRQRLGLADDAIVVGSVANLKAQKAPELFIGVAQDVITQQPGVEFVWVGDGPLRDAVAARLLSLGDAVSSRIHFVGATNDVAEWLSVFDVFVLTSAWEGLSGALMEAMSAGLPCVATDVPGTRDLVQHGANALLARFDRVGLAEELLRLISSRELQSALGSQARREMRENYGRDTLALRTAAVFESVLHTHQ